MTNSNEQVERVAEAILSESTHEISSNSQGIYDCECGLWWDWRESPDSARDAARLHAARFKARAAIAALTPTARTVETTWGIEYEVDADTTIYERCASEAEARAKEAASPTDTRAVLLTPTPDADRKLAEVRKYAELLLDGENVLRATGVTDEARIALEASVWCGISADLRAILDSEARS